MWDIICILYTPLKDNKVVLLLGISASAVFSHYICDIFEMCVRRELIISYNIVGVEHEKWNDF
jgi:hypothetical protein